MEARLQHHSAAQQHWESGTGRPPNPPRSAIASRCGGAAHQVDGALVGRLPSLWEFYDFIECTSHSFEPGPPAAGTAAVETG
jgi:hypothetical protein